MREAPSHRQSTLDGVFGSKRAPALTLTHVQPPRAAVAAAKAPQLPGERVCGDVGGLPVRPVPAQAARAEASPSKAHPHPKVADGAEVGPVVPRAPALERDPDTALAKLGLRAFRGRQREAVDAITSGA